MLIFHYFCKSHTKQRKTLQTKEIANQKKILPRLKNRHISLKNRQCSILPPYQANNPPEIRRAALTNTHKTSFVKIF